MNIDAAEPEDQSEYYREVSIGIDASAKGINEARSKFKHYNIATELSDCGDYHLCQTNDYFAGQHVVDYTSDDEANIFKTGDDIKMELDTKNTTLKCYKNGQKIGAWFDKVEFDRETKYNMVVRMYGGDHSIELTSFTMTDSHK